MQRLGHVILTWANWIFVLAIVLVVAFFVTIPVISDLVRGLVGFIVFLFNPLGITILRKAVEIISNIDVTP